MEPLGQRLPEPTSSGSWLGVTFLIAALSLVYSATVNELAGGPWRPKTIKTSETGQTREHVTEVATFKSSTSSSTSYYETWPIKSI